MRKTFLEVDIKEFRNNIDKIKKYANNKEIMPVIKASGYGTFINTRVDVLNDFNDIKFIKVSAKDGKNITKAFNEMIDLLDEDSQEKNDNENKDESGKKNKGTKLKNKKSNINKKCC